MQVISGQFLSDRRTNTYVEVDMLGLPADTVRRRYKTKSQTSNSLSPIFDSNPFVFKKASLTSRGRTPKGAVALVSKQPLPTRPDKKSLG